MWSRLSLLDRTSIKGVAFLLVVGLLVLTVYAERSRAGGRRFTDTYSVDIDGVVDSPLFVTKGNGDATKFEPRGASAVLNLDGLEILAEVDLTEHDNFCAADGTQQLDDAEWTQGTMTAKKNGDFFVRFGIRFDNSCKGFEAYTLTIEFKDENLYVSADGKVRIYDTESAALAIRHHAETGKGKNRVSHGEKIVGDYPPTLFGAIAITITKLP